MATMLSDVCNRARLPQNVRDQFLLNPSGEIVTGKCDEKIDGFARTVFYLSSNHEIYRCDSSFCAKGIDKAVSKAICISNTAEPSVARIKIKDLPPEARGQGEESPIVTVTREIGIIKHLHEQGITGIPDILAVYGYCSRKPHQLKRQVMIQPFYGSTLSEKMHSLSDPQKRSNRSGINSDA